MDTKSNNILYMCKFCGYKYKTLIGVQNCIHPYSIQSSL